MKTDYIYKQFNTYLLVLIISLLYSCAPSVSTTSSQNADFAKYKTYAWSEPQVKTGDNPLYSGPMIDRSIRDAVDREMADRNIIKTDKNPDLLVTYQTYTEKKEVTTRNNYPVTFGYGWGYGWGGFGYPYYPYGFNHWNSSDTYTYTEGVLILDFIDNKTQEVVWRGSVDGNVDNADKINQKIEKAVQSIMKKTPMNEIPS